MVLVKIKLLIIWEFLFKLSRCLIEDTPNAVNFIRTQICSLNRHSLKDIECSIDDELIQLPPYS